MDNPERREILSKTQKEVKQDMNLHEREKIYCHLRNGNFVRVNHFIMKTM
jgi:uncharacterized protein YeeX (DUF496 family)